MALTYLKNQRKLLNAVLMDDCVEISNNLEELTVANTPLRA